MNNYHHRKWLWKLVCTHPSKKKCLRNHHHHHPAKVASLQRIRQRKNLRMRSEINQSVKRKVTSSPPVRPRQPRSPTPKAPFPPPPRPISTWTSASPPSWPSPTSSSTRRRTRITSTRRPNERNTISDKTCTNPSDRFFTLWNYWGDGPSRRERRSMGRGSSNGTGKNQRPFTTFLSPCSSPTRSSWGHGAWWESFLILGSGFKNSNCSYHNI